MIEYRSTQSGELLNVVVAARGKQTDDVIALELRAPDGRDLPPFEPGAHIDLHVGDGLIRQYSLCNNAKETDRYRIGVLREPRSRGGSKAIHDQVHVGSRLRIGHPRNNFRMAETGARSLLLAGGIGITPLMAMAYHLSGYGAPFRLHYCCRSRSRAAFLDELTESAFADSVFCHFDDGAANQAFSAEKALGSYSAGDHAYACGPGGFMEYIVSAAMRLGWPGEAIHREYFSASVDASGNAFTVVAKRSGRTVTVQPGQTIVEALSDCGIAIPISCEQGVCGTCLTRVLGGLPEHRDLFQSDEEKALNSHLTPCCSRSKTPTLVLDI